MKRKYILPIILIIFIVSIFEFAFEKIISGSGFLTVRAATEAEISIKVPSNVHNNLAQQLKEKEQALLKKEESIRGKELKLTAGGILNEDKIPLALLFGALMLTTLASTNFYFKRKKEKNSLALEKCQDICAGSEIISFGGHMATMADRSSRKVEYDIGRFGENVIEFVKRVPKDSISGPLTEQLIKTGTRAGAYYCGAERALSQKEFLVKIKNCEREMRETRHWLRMLVKASPFLKGSARVLWYESQELSSVLIITINKSEKKHKYSVYGKKTI